MGNFKMGWQHIINISRNEAITLIVQAALQRCLCWWLLRW